MKNNLVVEKAVLGIRYLLKYCDNKNVDNFKIVKDCISETKLWLLITFFANNMDNLWQSIPDFLFDDLFLMRPVEIKTESVRLNEIGYGKGFKSNSILPFKEQFKIIRNSLSHGDFTFKDDLILINRDDYNAVFDILWLSKLTMILLSNDRFELKKGMSDISIISVVPDGEYSIEQFVDFCNKGLINLYKVTSITNNKEKVFDVVKMRDFEVERCTFDFLFQNAIRMMQTKFINPDLSKDEIDEILCKYFKEIENRFNGCIKIELVPIKSLGDLFNRKDFQELSYLDKMYYMINYIKFQNPGRYNAIIINYLMGLLEKISCDSLLDKDLFLLNDSCNFLIKTYANIYFTGLNNNSFLSQDYLEKLGAKCNFVHAKNIYKDYLKALNRSLKDLQEYNGTYAQKEYIFQKIALYSALLEEVISNLPYKDVSWKLRNSIIHNHLDFVDDDIRFYTTGGDIKLRHYSKKNKEWEFKTFSNDKPIWSMVIDKYEFLGMLDELFQKNKIQVWVNISKYCKRSTYLK